MSRRRCSWLLTGDAGQRAIVAQAMGWPPAQQASGHRLDGCRTSRSCSTIRTTPCGSSLARSLRTLPEFGSFEYDFAAAADRRRDAQRRVMTTFARVRGRLPRPGDPRLLLTQEGDVD